MKFSLSRADSSSILASRDFPVFPFSGFLVFLVAVTLLITTTAVAQVVNIPDANLERAIQEELGIPAAAPVTQPEILQLTGLTATEIGIADLTGLEHAANLGYLDVGGNQIRDIRPLAELINLTGLSLASNPVEDISPLANLANLTHLNLAGNGVETVEPLAGLIQLQTLDLYGNRVKDITPLANMTALTRLILSYNQVGDLTPVANLVSLERLYLRNNQVSDLSPLTNHPNLEILDIRHNPASDFSPLNGMNLTRFEYDEVCDFPPLGPPVIERIENRTFPSVFQAWDHVQNMDHLPRDQSFALHDLFFSPRHEWGLYWKITPTEPAYGLATALTGDFEYAREVRRRWLNLNTNMVLLEDIRLHNHFDIDAFPPNSDFWLRNDEGQIVQNVFNEYVINFLKPEVQDLLIKRIIAVERCGLADGIMLDGFNNNGIGFVGRDFFSVTDEDIIQAHLNILHAVRSQVRDDFLILINTSRSKATRYTEYVNGAFMETGNDYPGGYTHDGLKEIESTLIWSEENFRSPQINCLEGWGMSIEPPDGPNNRRWMRVFTTMSLTLSNGYVLYTIAKGSPSHADWQLWYPFWPVGMPDVAHHWHLWYPFWDADLGRPVGPKAQQYQNIEGIYIREFTNGWAVYNRSGKEQTISLPESATGVSSGNSNITHQLPDLDGEMYLKIKNPADVNGDWEVNVLDLVQVANGLGKSAPDPNGDGVVNILDLVFVAQQFDQ